MEDFHVAPLYWAVQDTQQRLSLLKSHRANEMFHYYRMGTSRQIRDVRFLWEAEYCSYENQMHVLGTRGLGGKTWMEHHLANGNAIPAA